MDGGLDLSCLAEMLHLALGLVTWALEMSDVGECCLRLCLYDNSLKTKAESCRLLAARSPQVAGELS